MPELNGEHKESLVGHGTWVGMEWSEGSAHEAGNPAGASSDRKPLKGRKSGPVQVRASIVAKKRCKITPWSQGTQEGRCKMEQNDESQKLTGTSACAKSAAMPAGDIALRWKWVERSVWTDRMLMALERGVKGGGPMPTLTGGASGGWPERTLEIINQ
jgi:hypothetical protein